MKTEEPTFNAARLTLARERRGLTKRAFATLVGCTERTVGEWERGKTPSDDSLERIAHATSFPVSFFMLDDPETLPENAVSFRSLARLRSADASKALSAARIAFDLTTWIEQRFNLPAPDLPDLPHDQGNPENAAEAIRRRWGLGDKPIKSMVTLLEHKGVRVFSLAEDTTDMDAFATWRGQTPFVFLNSKKSSEASRFDAAHELGHLVLHKHGAPIGRSAERQAHAFASALLMPATSVLAYAPKAPTISNLVKAKHLWNVSVAALAHRMHALGLISDWRYRGLCIELQDRGYRTNEPESAAREKSQVFEKVFQALRQSGTGKREIAQQLCIPVSELDSLVFDLVLSASAGGGKEALGDISRPTLTLLK